MWEFFTTVTAILDMGIFYHKKNKKINIGLIDLLLCSSFSGNSGEPVDLAGYGLFCNIL